MCSRLVPAETLASRPLPREMTRPTISPGRPVRPQTPAAWLRIVLVALIVALGSGTGLPGIVRALTPAHGHVCTCAAGGAHTSCPVCNHSVRDKRSRVVEVNGVPCGDGSIAIAGVYDCAVVVAPWDCPPIRFVRACATRDGAVAPHSPSPEPPTPPPRIASA